MTDEKKPGRYQYRISEDGERRFLVDTVDDLWSCADCTDKDWVRDRLNSLTEEVEAVIDACDVGNGAIEPHGLPGPTARRAVELALARKDDMIRSLRDDIAKKQEWIDNAVKSCAEKECWTKDRRLREQEGEISKLTEEVERLKLARNKDADGVFYAEKEITRLKDEIERLREEVRSYEEDEGYTVTQQAKRIEEYQRLLDSLAKQRDGYGDNDIARDYQMFLDEREQKDKRIEELENNEARIKELLWHLANDSITPKGEIDNVADCVLRLVEQTREDSVRQMQLRTRIEELEYGHQQMLLILEDPDCMQLPDPFASMRSIARKALAEGGEK
jgi:hypothetical protein